MVGKFWALWASLTVVVIIGCGCLSTGLVIYSFGQITHKGVGLIDDKLAKDACNAKGPNGKPLFVTPYYVSVQKSWLVPSHLNFLHRTLSPLSPPSLLSCIFICFFMFLFV